MRRLIVIGLLSALTVSAARGGFVATDRREVFQPRRKLALARLATAKYVNSLDCPRRRLRVITPMIPDMGVHFMNAKVSGSTCQAADPRVREAAATLAARCARVGVPDSRRRRRSRARYGSFPAACHYVDGTSFADSQQFAAPPSADGRMRVLRTAPRHSDRAPRSGSGTPTSSRCTCGSGTRTRRACSRA